MLTTGSSRSCLLITRLHLYQPIQYFRELKARQSIYRKKFSFFRANALLSYVVYRHFTKSVTFKFETLALLPGPKRFFRHLE